MTRSNQDSGINNQYGYVTLRNCTLTDNNGSFGGALFNNGGEATLINCLVTGNRASQGGGLYNEGGKLILQHCTISGNSAEQGGGIENWSGDLALIDCTVSGNLTNSTFTDSEGGAGILNFGRLAMTNCTFSDNQVARYGAGAIFTNGGMTVNNCTFVNNKGEIAGAIWDYGSSSARSVLSDCTFSENFVVGQDGIAHSNAIYANYQYIDITHGIPSMAVNNCTFSGISSDPGSLDGGAILAAGQNTKVEVANTLFRRVSGGGASSTVTAQP